VNGLTRKLLRTVQVQFPGLQSTKYRVKRAMLSLGMGPSEPDFRALRLFPDRLGKLYLDVGANRGQSTDALLMIAPRSPIESFEPNPLLSTHLQQLYSKHERVRVHPFGLGDRTQSLTLYVPCYKNWMFDGLASLCRADAEQALDDQLYFYRRRLLSVREFQCDIRRLDDLQLDPFFIKIDTEGFEQNVLRGSIETLARSEPILLVESPHSETVQLLQRYGYAHYAYRGGRFHGGQHGQRNTFFMTPPRVETVARHILPAAI
jgi:FkbM family methyltransferase